MAVSSSATIRLALDWTPNSNHAGFYVGLSQGWFAEAGIELELISPDVDDYTLTPGRRCANGGAEFCLGPSESAISFATTEPGKPKLKAVAAVMNSDSSAIVTLASSGLSRPCMLDGRTYASYSGRFEMNIVRQMIKNDGGVGSVIEEVPPKLGIWDTLLSGGYDSTWVFMGWEGVQASRKGIELNTFHLSDYNCPYGYTPILLADPAYIASNPELTRRFLEVCARGFTFAAEQPRKAAEMMCQVADHPTLSDVECVEECQVFAASYILDSNGQWGRMQLTKWTEFVDWLFTNECIADRQGLPIPRDALNVNELFTNEFLPADA